MPIGPIARAIPIAVVGWTALGLATPGHATQVVVTIENLAPETGTFLTPAWVGFHDGTFDLYDRDVSLNSGDFDGMEALVEDGNTGPLSDRFANEGRGTVQGTLPGPFAPGETVRQLFSLDESSPQSRYFSYASMVIPSNDAFIANGNPLAHSLFQGGQLVGTEFIVLGSMVLDGGTEVNDEIPESTAFLGQTAPNTGVDENGVVVSHPGFQATGNGGILDDPRFAGADFTAEGYEVARISVQVVPVPAALPLFAAGLAALAAIGARRRQRA